jgi:hypothetical protein
MGPNKSRRCQYFFFTYLDGQQLYTIVGSAPEASFLNGFSHLCGELAPTQWWHLAELAPMRKLAPMHKLAPTLVLKKLPSASVIRNLLNIAETGANES